MGDNVCTVYSVNAPLAMTIMLMQVSHASQCRRLCTGMVHAIL